MVDDLFASPRAGQEVDVNVFANDVVTAQTAEIGIMQADAVAAPAEVNRRPPSLPPPEYVPMRMHAWLHRCSLATAVVPTLVSAQTYPTNDDPRSNLKPGRLRRRHRGQQHAPGVVRAEAGGSSTRRAA